MSVPAYVYDFITKGYKSATAGTAITYGIDGQRGRRLALIDGRVTAAGTAHTLSIMYAKDAAAYPGSSRNSCAAGAAAGQKDIVCDVAPKDPAGNAAAASDIVGYEVSDGTWEFNTVASLASSTITLSTNIAKAIPAGAKVLIFGVVGDGSLFALAVPASAQAKFGEGRICVLAPYKDDALWVSDNNATAAGSIDNLVFGYISR